MPDNDDESVLLLQFFSKTTERFVHGVDSFVDTLWKIWSDLLDVMGIDCKFPLQLSPPHTHKKEIKHIL